MDYQTLIELSFLEWDPFHKRYNIPTMRLLFNQSNEHKYIQDTPSFFLKIETKNNDEIIHKDILLFRHSIIPYSPFQNATFIQPH